MKDDGEYDDVEIQIHNDDDDDNDLSDDVVGPAESASDGGLEQQSDAVMNFLRTSKPHRSAPPSSTYAKQQVSLR